MSTWTGSDLKQQYDRVVNDGWLQHFQDASLAYFWPVELLLAIGSRESNIQQIMGDNGNGAGIMQIDRRHNAAFVSSGIWQNIRQNVFYGARILSQKRQFIVLNFEEPIRLGPDSKGNFANVTIPRMDEIDLVSVSLAAYNVGLWAVYHYVNSHNPDKTTTGGDYSNDVTMRAQVFRGLI